MKVIHVIATLQRRGAETFAADLVRALDRRGVVQEVVALRRGDSPYVEPVARTSTVLASGKTLPGLDPRIVRRLRRTIVSRRPDIVQAHGGEALKYCVAAGARSRGAISYRRIGEIPHNGKLGLRRLFYRALMRRASRVIAVSTPLREDIIKTFGLDAASVVVIPNAVDAARLTPVTSRDEVRAALGLTHENVVVLSLGALVHEKAPLDHIAAASRVLDIHPEAVHVIVGDGVLRPEVESAAGAAPAARRIKVLGSRADVADLLHASDVLLFASRSEGMPAAIIEAGAASLPVAAFALPGVAEVVVHEETGLLAPPGDTAALAACLERLVVNSDLRAALGLAARRRCVDTFGIESAADAYLALYRDALAGSS